MAPTIKQKRALENIVENRGNVGKSMVEAGYEESTAKNPKNLTDSKGYKELLEEYGLTEQLVTTALVADIKSKEGKRTAELSLGAEILGMRKMGPVIANQISFREEKMGNENGNEKSKETMQEFADVIEAYLYAKLSNRTEVTIPVPFVKKSIWEHY